jgi:hypothetical protein
MGYDDRRFRGAFTVADHSACFLTLTVAVYVCNASQVDAAEFAAFLNRARAASPQDDYQSQNIPTFDEPTPAPVSRGAAQVCPYE